jgi:PTH1 family peptidyl-tRNA hydrolase
VTDTVRFVAALGNPGSRYRMTWHNAGYWVADILTRHHEVEFSNAGAFLVASLPFGIDIIKPTEFMNRSGAAVRVYMDHLGCSPKDVLVVCDDVNLPLGALRLRASGSDGGHNGLRDVIRALGTESFPRLRLGVGPPPEQQDLRDFVLEKVPDELQDTASRMAHRAVECILAYATEGLEEAQNRFNRTDRIQD